MKFGKKRDHSSAELEITPLIDMVFLLIIFFLISTSFENYKNINIEFPSSETASEQKIKTIEIFITGENSILIEEKKYSIGEFQTFIAGLDKEIKNVTINGDKSISYQYIVNIMDILRKNGLNNIILGVKSY